jgi:hypothetical protein
MSMQTTPALQAGECRITLSRSEWHILHHILSIVLEHPAEFGGTVDNPAGAAVLGGAVHRIQAKLPPPGAGGY